MEQLFKDITNGMLRRKRGADYDLSDSDDGGEARKRMKHQQLLSETINQIRQRFVPKVGDIKKCIEILLDKALLKSQKVLASAGAHTEALRVKVKDLHMKEGATLGQFGDKAKIKLQKAVKKAKKSAQRVAKGAKKALKKAAKKKKA